MQNKTLSSWTTKVVNLNSLTKEVVLNGWIKKIVKVSSLAFLTLYDSFGSCQLVIQEKNKSVWEQLLKLTKESVVQVVGVVQQKVNSSTQQKPVAELLVQKMKIINLAKITPFLIKNQTDGNEKLRLQYRYLDLRREKMQNIFKLRHHLYQVIRQFFQQWDGFLEIDTPILAKPTIEGARNFLVTSQAQKKSIFALPQSPQIYKQLLMTAGFAGYFQFARCFRDEDMRNDRQPEFSQLDLEINFANQKLVIDFVEKMIVSIFSQTKDLQISTPFLQLDYQTAWNKYGSDSPDLRYQLFLEDFSHLQLPNTSSPQVMKGIYFQQNLSASAWKTIQTEIQKITSTNLLFYFAGSKVETNLTSLQQEKLTKHPLYKNQWNWIGFCGNLEQTNLILGKVRTQLAQAFGLTKNNHQFQFCWIINPPMFKFSQTDNKYVAIHHPFTQPQDVNQFWDNWKNSIANAYDLVCNGSELGSGSERIYDLRLQKQVFAILGLTEKQITNEFGYFLQAMQYGFPNHAGFALGLDRLLMILVDVDSIRDVLAFPKTSKLTSILGHNSSNNEQRE